MPPTRPRSEIEVEELKAAIGKLTEEVVKLTVQLATHNTEQVTVSRDISTILATLQTHQGDINRIGEIARGTRKDLDDISASLNKFIWYIIAPILGTFGIAILFVIVKYLEGGYK